MAGLLDSVNALASDPRYSGLLNSANQTVSNPVNSFVTPVSASSGNAGNAFMASVQAIKDAAAKKLVDPVPKTSPSQLRQYVGANMPGTGRDPEVGQYRRGNLPQQAYADGSMKYPVYKGPTERVKIQTGMGSFKYADVPTTGPFREVSSLSSPEVLKYPDFYGVTEQDYIDYFDRYGPDTGGLLGTSVGQLQGAGPTGQNPGKAISQMSDADLRGMIPNKETPTVVRAALMAMPTTALMGLAFSGLTHLGQNIGREAAFAELQRRYPNKGNMASGQGLPSLSRHPSMPAGIGVAPPGVSVNRGMPGSFGQGER